MSGVGTLSSDDRTDTMLELWGDGLSAGKIANRMTGVTRNAVIGRIDRLRLKFNTHHMTLERLAEHIADGGDPKAFDRDQPLGSYGFAAIRRMMGEQAR